MATFIAPFAAKKAAQPALIDEFGTTNWDSFNSRVNQLIHYLRGAGLNVGDTIAVVSGNRREYLEVLTAAAHAGWQVVPVNWHLVPEEIAYILNNSGAKILFGDERFKDLCHETLRHDLCPQLNEAILFGDIEQGHAFKAYEEALSTQVDDEPEGQCMGGPMFYTSGTTGKPKGVKGALAQTGVPLETFQGIAEYMMGLLQFPNEGATFLNGPIYHSAQWAFAFIPLMFGSSLLIRHKFDAEEMLRLVDEYQITNLHLVPTQFNRTLRLDDAIKSSFKGDSLQIVWHGAAPCSVDIKRSMIDWWGPIICEYYGSTEGAIVTTASSDDWLRRPGTLGKPSPINEIIVVKDDGTKAETGEVGTLYIKNLRGAGFKYHDDDGKTTDAYLEPDLFTVGDVGYLDSDGYMFMSDRKIDMIISGGVNIYPAEIESVLINHPSVTDSAVFGIPNEDFGEEVKGAVELAEGYDASEDLKVELIEHCRKHLAGFKAPRSIDFVDTMPRHPTGKLLKRLLRDEYWKNKSRAI